MTIFNNIKKTAISRGLSIENVAELATKSGVKVSKSTIYDWDKHEPNPNKLKAVADILNVSTDYLLGNTDEMMPNKKGSATEPEEIDLDAALEDKGVVMRFQGKELSDKAKRGILDIIKLVDGDED